MSTFAEVMDQRRLFWCVLCLTVTSLFDKTLFLSLSLSSWHRYSRLLSQLLKDGIAMSFATP